MDILKLNAISPLADEILEGYNLTDASDAPVGILVRSANMAEYAVPSSLLAVARAGAGVNNIPHADYAARGIVVFNTPGANANSVKEMVICELILAARNIAESIAWASSLTGDDVAKQVEKGKKQFVGHEILGKTLAVLGLGAIGRKVAVAANALGMNVVGYDPYLSEAAKSEIPFVTVLSTPAEACAEADFVTLHMPATAETTGMINADSLAAMKDGVVIINAARAELDFANSMYLDAELGLLNLGWKDRVSYYYSDYYNPNTPIGDYTETDFTQRMNAYYLHLPIHAGYRWNVARRCAIYVDAGPYFSLGLFGKAKTTDHIKNETHKTIWCWTGFLYEEILADPHLSMLLPYIDVLVDGPFIQEKKDRDLLFRGSSNQRILYLSGKEEDIIPGTVPLVPVK